MASMSSLWLTSHTEAMVGTRSASSSATVRSARCCFHSATTIDDVVGDRLAEGGDGGLGRGVGALARLGRACAVRRYVDHATRTAVEHARQHGEGAGDEAEEVDVEQPVERVEIGLLDGRGLV